jgi:hypothetical protein
LRSRLRNHIRGPSRTSTLRRTLAALLAYDLQLQRSRTLAGKTILLGDGDERLTQWMAKHMRVYWLICDEPQELEARLLGDGPALPLNIQGSSHPFARELRERRQSFLFDSEDSALW